MTLNILLMAGIGDAWGVCFEYAPKHIIQKQLLEKPENKWSYFPHHKYNIGNGRYSDDLQMHIAVAETLLAGSLDEMSFIEAFVRCYQRDPREGYSGAFYTFLQTVKDARDFAARIKPESEKSGAAMRSACLGVLCDIQNILDIAACQARTTHNTPKGIAAAQASALMLHYLLFQKGSRADLPNFINHYIPLENWNNLPIVKIGHLGIDSVKAALRSLTQEQCLTDILKSIISCGGDTDTAATIAMAAACCTRDIRQDLPSNLIDTFENGLYGKNYIIDLDKKLTAFAIAQGAPSL